MVYDKLVKRATLLAVVAATTLIIIKLIAWWLTDAVTLLASLFDSSIDMFASGINFLLVRYALLPADRGHAFGHGKAEPLAALAQSAFIAGSAVFLLLSSIKSMLDPSPLTFPLVGIFITLISLVITVILLSYQYSVIKRTSSQAIKADMLHYKSDLLMNGAVLVALLLSWYGFLRADGIFACLISLYILYSAFNIGAMAIQSLLDKALPDEAIRKIERIALSVPHINGVHDIRTRQSGKTTFIQLHLELPDTMPLIESHTLSDKVMLTIKHAFPDSDITIHQDPVSVVPHELAEGHELPAMNQRGEFRK